MTAHHYHKLDKFQYYMMENHVPISTNSGSDCAEWMIDTFEYLQKEIVKWIYGEPNSEDKPYTHTEHIKGKHSCFVDIHINK